MTSALELSKLPIGVGQVWTNVSSSRALNTTYTNTTGKPIQIHATFDPATVVNTALVTTVDGTLTYGAPATAAGVSIGTQAVIVPPGSTYRVATNNSSSPSLANWVELR